MCVVCVCVCVCEEGFSVSIMYHPPQVVGVTGEMSGAVFTSATLCLLINGETHCLPYDSSTVISPNGIIHGPWVSSI